MLASTCAYEATGSELTGTSWQLVRIVSMNDSIDVPNDSAKYTMELLVGGQAVMHADCNRGAGS